MHSHFDKNPGESMEQQSAFAQKVYSKLKNVGQKSGSSAPSARGSAPSPRGGISPSGKSGVKSSIMSKKSVKSQ